MPFCISWLQSSGTPAAAAAADLELQLPGPKPPEPKPPDTKLLYCSLLLGIRRLDWHRSEHGGVTLSCSACSTCKSSNMHKSVAACQGSGSMQGMSCSSMQRQQHAKAAAAECSCKDSAVCHACNHSAEFLLCTRSLHCDAYICTCTTMPVSNTCWQSWLTGQS